MTKVLAFTFLFEIICQDNIMHDFNALKLVYGQVYGQFSQILYCE